ncbi:Oidioi.mRNA.OKI2018_I69.PAR.g10878.t2.cds [Oikopleura dioica]|uniref:Oidioi.mRNA.OKI2018_I69.PAR.g10878.t2.cds n=1 Tax=Oikopleura dioica TaxID=34765 RepID=A0ABN7RSU1_OIKDI|nr:Oidioi.mRNA.OKI2018_I69.PAR.g10878.t2.cds [Oikopleura dioica]
MKKFLICSAGTNDEPEGPPMVPLASARATDTVFRKPLPLGKKATKRRQQERPKSARSFSSVKSFRLTPFAKNYDENREKEEIAAEILDSLLSFIPELPPVTRPWSASTVRTVVSEMTIPSPVETPRENSEPKSIWQKIAAWPVLGLRKVSPSVWGEVSPRDNLRISPSSVGSTEL